MSSISDESRFLAIEDVRLRAETARALGRLRDTMTAIPQQVLGKITAHPLASGGVLAGAIGVIALAWSMRRHDARTLAQLRGTGRFPRPQTAASRTRLTVWMRRVLEFSQLLSTIAAALATQRGAGSAKRTSHPQPSRS